MIPVCVSRCEDCTKVQCIVRPGCGEIHYLGLGYGDASDEYNVYITNLLTGVTREYFITAGVAGDLLFNMQDAAAFLTGKVYRIIAIKVGQSEPAEIQFSDGTTFTCVEVEFKNLYDSNGDIQSPGIQWLTPY